MKINGNEENQEYNLHIKLREENVNWGIEMTFEKMTELQCSGRDYANIRKKCGASYDKKAGKWRFSVSSKNETDETGGL